MIQIIIVAAGIFILIKGKINFSKTRELVKPKSIYIGTALILIGVLVSFFNFFAYGLLIVAIIVSYFLSQKIVENTPTKLG